MSGTFLGVVTTEDLDVWMRVYQAAQTHLVGPRPLRIVVDEVAQSGPPGTDASEEFIALVVRISGMEYPSIGRSHSDARMTHRMTKERNEENLRLNAWQISYGLKAKPGFTLSAIILSPSRSMGQGVGQITIAVHGIFWVQGARLFLLEDMDFGMGEVSQVPTMIKV